MAGRSRILGVLIIALALVLQGVGMAGVAAGRPASASVACRVMAGNCDRTGSDHQAVASICQPSCTAPAAVPSSRPLAVLIHWNKTLFFESAVGIPAGLIRAPDPFPPRPFRAP